MAKENSGRDAEARFTLSHAPSPLKLPQSIHLLFMRCEVGSA